jgi:putative membrane protein
MSHFQALAHGVGAFAVYFIVAIFLLVVFKFIYAAITPYNEWKLIKDERNTAAAVGFGGAIIGFSAALASAAANSVSIIDFFVWGVIALIAQLIAFSIVRFIFMPKIAKRIEDKELSAGVVLACISIAVGLINAACMTY